MLVRELESGTRTFADLAPDAASIPPSVRDVLDTFRTAAALPAESLGAYVITMASRASDVLAVELAAEARGDAAPAAGGAAVRDAPPTSSASARCSTALFTLPWYRARIGGHQEVMVGYSDSAKDAGRFAAAWALYHAQERDRRRLARGTASA